MSQFKVHVQYIIYGSCGIELLIGNKLIKCDAGYGGPNPLASLIEACLDFPLPRKKVMNQKITSKRRKSHGMKSRGRCIWS